MSSIHEIAYFYQIGLAFLLLTFVQQIEVSRHLGKDFKIVPLSGSFIGSVLLSISYFTSLHFIAYFSDIALASLILYLEFKIHQPLAYIGRYMIRADYIVFLISIIMAVAGAVTLYSLQNIAYLALESIPYFSFVVIILGKNINRHKQ